MLTDKHNYANNGNVSVEIVMNVYVKLSISLYEAHKGIGNVDFVWVWVSFTQFTMFNLIHINQHIKIRLELILTTTKTRITLFIIEIWNMNKILHLSNFLFRLHMSLLVYGK